MRFDAQIKAASVEHPHVMIWLTAGRIIGGKQVVRLSLIPRQGPVVRCGEWSWQGWPMPSGILEDISARTMAVVQDDFITRYGIEEQLPF
jgi:hypothetical protein